MAHFGPLHGRHILITRAAHQAAAFVALLEQYGAQVTALPTIAVTEPTSWEALDGALCRLREQAAGMTRHYDWLFFTSANGVAFFLKRLHAHGDDPRRLTQSVRICAIGKGTAKAARDAGFEVALIPTRFNAEGVVESFLTLHEGRVAGLRVLLPRARVAREVLPTALAALGVHLDVVEAYQTVRGDFDPTAWRQRLESGEFDVTAFASASAVTQLVEAFPETPPAALLARTVIACIGPVTTQAARELGLTVAIEPSEATLPALAAAIAAYFSPQREHRPASTDTGA
ncbi:MAG: uroporphyrinogen-III synthase [Chloracidobacterium sp.]|nr:uroporphyrinogen-III synthase [Chloracidobacterium sp.]MDW8216005.1 uroporphyrinogen-III synthase [Acidobacteriota bacterium]